MLEKGGLAGGAAGAGLEQILDSDFGNGILGAILASTDIGDFDPYENLPFKSVSDDETTYFRYGLVTAKNVHNIAITGQGTIDGNRTARRGPKTVAIKLCQFVTIRGIIVRNSLTASSVTGIPGYPVRRVSLSNLMITMEGGNGEPMTLDVPEHVDKYPEGTMFGVLPAYGLYCRHAEELGLASALVRWGKEDLRPAMIFDDVKNLTIDGFRTDTAAGVSPVVWMNNVIDALVRGARTCAVSTFLRVSGSGSKGISLIGNDLAKAGRHVELAGAPKSAVNETSGAAPAATRKRE